MRNFNEIFRRDGACDNIETTGEESNRPLPSRFWLKVSRKENFVNNVRGFESLFNSMNVLNKYASGKKIFARGNQMLLMKKDISKEMMKSSRLLNKFLSRK